MLSQAPHASWHPAFMPNAAPDLVASESEAPTESPARDSFGSGMQSIESHIEEQDSREDGGHVIEGREEPLVEDNTDHPELTNLRDALTTSLASPGGVEMEESPLHNGAPPQETIHRETSDSHKADFPSAGPKDGRRHQSTTSFARTVSQEVDLGGEDDEVDPEWSLARTNTDPFKHMAISDRTNSFPAVPPIHPYETKHLEQPLAHSQAEEIIGEIEQPNHDLFSDDGNEDDFFTQKAVAAEDAFPNAPFDGRPVDSDYGQTYGGDVREEQDNVDQARYEEGLPLVQPEGDHISSHQSSTGLSFMDDGVDEDEDFFARVSSPPDEEATPRPDGLTRKSTMQVMGSLQFQSHSQTHDEILEDEEKDDLASSQSSLDKATGGGLGSSKSTVLAQVLGDPEAVVHEQLAEQSGLEPDAADTDLAAKWKAALEGDEFLDDDDELLDDEASTEGNPVDPAAFFGSDDEGFLEDTEEQNQTTNCVSQNAAPPLSGPISGMNGQMEGLDGLTSSAPANQRSVSSRYVPTGASTIPVEQPQTSYTPTAPFLTDLSRPAPSPSVSSPYMSPQVGFSGQQHQPPPPRPQIPKAQSFADKAKGGYASPYDLPMEVVMPRKRISMQNMGRGYSASPSLPGVAPPPPRSSSRPGQIPSSGSIASLSPPLSSHGTPQNQSAPVSSVPQPRPSSSQSKGVFFEELPVAPRARPSPRSSLGPDLPTPYSAANTSAQQLAGPPVNNANPSSTQSPPMHSQQPRQAPQSSLPQSLIAPERVSPYANLPSNNMSTPAVTSRYSPAPTQPHTQTAPPPASRYSPAPVAPIRQHMPAYAPPPANTQPPPPVLAHLPRTSSPLAHFERSQEYRSSSSGDIPNLDRRINSSGYEPSLRTHQLPSTREVDENESVAPLNSRNYGGPPNQHSPLAAQTPPQAVQQISQSPPLSQDLASRNLLSPSKRAVSSYIPQQPVNGAPRDFVRAPPIRSQTQSPGAVSAGPRLEMNTSEPHQRPASVHVPSSPSATSAYASMANISSGRPRGFSQGLNYIAPIDGRENDPMQRWKGAPVFAWGVGGTLITSFPKDVPRYGPTQSTPMIIRSPGEVKIQNIKEVDPLDERLTSFPGPLKGKSKKKDLLAWLTSGITNLEQGSFHLPSKSSLVHEDKRTEERVLLWKILRVFVEHDGVLEGNPTVEKAVRAVLSPGLDEENAQHVPLYATGVDLSGISQSSISNPRADPVDPAAVDHLRKHLLRGEREKAVWEAVDKRLWAHALLISNTVSKDLYKQVAQEFIQKEVKTTCENTESLAALYEIFAGNFEESIDELVPPSARAGFKMVSTSSGSGSSKDSLEGLDRWRETLGLVLSNRSTDDNQALNALGKLLAGYGRAEAAHICFLFARNYSVFGGIDDPLSSIVLVGSDHQRQPYEFDRELESILLSEVYEYGLAMSNTSVSSLSIPHLAVYKLQHATILAEYGFREKALQYCEAIASSITSQTKRSPYHHALLVAALDDLNKRLKQSPKDEGSSWISKPSMDKVSGSVWAKFSKFVAGDENDAAADGTTGGNGSEVGPFARIAGGTPNVSRSPSNSDLYGSYGNGLAMTGINGMNGGVAITQSNKSSSRYAPGGAYTPPTHEPQLGSSYGSQPRTSFEQRSSSEYRRGPYEPLRQSSDYRPISQSGSQPNSLLPGFTPQPSYGPYGVESPNVHRSPDTPTSDRPTASNVYDSPQSFSNDNAQPVTSYAPNPSYHSQTSSSYEPPASSGYEPPTASGYEPPSYEPATMNDEPDSPVDTRPKKKSFMDDDDDMPIPKPSGEKTKAEKDREADEAFRRAAEEDAKKAKDAAAAPKRGWGLGGWFGGGKKEAAAETSQPGKPIKAKLGEASSFVYDPELKRWINKKIGTDTTPTPSSTPPPPRAPGPPRTASGPPGMSAASGLRSSSAAATHPPMRPTQSLSDINNPGPSGPSDGPITGPSNLAAPPTMSRSVSSSSYAGGPPSRPGTSMSNASSIDDLLGPPTARKSAAKGKKKGRGYIDVMGEKK